MKKIFLLLIFASTNTLQSSELVKSYDERLFSDDIKVVKEAISLGADLNAKNNHGYTALMLAALGGGTRLEIAKLLIASGADLNIKNSNSGETTLILAALSNELEVVKLLIELGADINIQDAKGYTALIFAASFNRLEIIKLLIEAGADLNIKNELGCTALILAKKFGHEEIAKLIKEKIEKIKKEVSDELCRRRLLRLSAY